MENLNNINVGMDFLLLKQSQSPLWRILTTQKFLEKRDLLDYGLIVLEQKTIFQMFLKISEMGKKIPLFFLYLFYILSNINVSIFFLVGSSWKPLTRYLLV